MAAAMAGILLVGCEDAGSLASDEPAEILRVLAYNIRHGEGLDGRVDLERIGRLINQVEPDLVALQEVDSGAARTGGVDQAAVLAKLTGLTPTFGPFLDLQGGFYGMAVLSRWEVLRTRNVRLPDGCVRCVCPPACPEPRSSVVATVRSPRTSRQVVFAGVHFYQDDQERLAQAQALSAALAGENAPVIMAGDFNSERGTPVMESLRPQWMILEKQSAPHTFPSVGPDREIDFVLVRQDAQIQILRHVVLDEAIASDHRPVLAELLLRPPSL